MLTYMRDTICAYVGEFLHLVKEKIVDYFSMQLCLTEIAVTTAKRAYPWLE
jgi:hypothetical protein